MMVVVTVMAEALHLFKTLRANTLRCQLRRGESIEATSPRDVVERIFLAARKSQMQTKCGPNVSSRVALLQSARGGTQNGAMRGPVRLAALLLTLLCLSASGLAQNQDRDSSGVPKTSAAAPPAEQRVDINHASVEELAKVPGLTLSWAGRIVRFRPYRTKQDLFEKGVVSSEVYDRIKDLVIAHRDKK